MLSCRHLSIALALAMFAGGVGADVVDPKWNYLLHCSGCHLEDGRGGLPDIPDLRKDTTQLLRVPGGRQYLATVPGVLQAPLSDLALATLLNWILTDLVMVPADVAPYTPEEIAAFRLQPQLDPLRQRARLLGSRSD